MNTFNSIEEFSEWMKANKVDIENLNITPSVDTVGYVHEAGIPITTDTVTITTSDSTNQQWVISDNSNTTITPSPTKEVSVIVKSLSDQPEIKVVPLTESEEDINTWYVDDFESVENACSTSKVMYKGSTLLMNVCESEGVSKVTLIMEVDGKIQHIPFRLEKACQSCEDHDMIISL